MIVASLRRNFFAAERGARLHVRGGNEAMARAALGVSCESRRCGKGEPLQNNQTGEDARHDRARWKSSQCLEWRHLQLVRRNQIAVNTYGKVFPERCRSATYGRSVMRLLTFVSFKTTKSQDPEV
jgi:hypothetical protein